MTYLQRIIYLTRELEWAINLKPERYDWDRQTWVKQGGNKVGLSMEDKKFMQVMDRSFHKDVNRNWVDPLQFCEYRSRFPNSSLKHSIKPRIYTTVCPSTLSDLSANICWLSCSVYLIEDTEVAPPLNNENCCYLPIFGVYHPEKPSQIRAVFDSSAQQQGISLNSVFSGLDLMNNLRRQTANIS